MSNVEFLLELIIKENQFQEKYLTSLLTKLTAKERGNLERVVGFYEKLGYSIEQQANSYLMFLNDTLEETKYFIENGVYRYSKFKDVAAHVYFNQEYMTKYMIGLAISTYLWSQHLMIMQWFEKKMSSCQSGKYLEIGPGHGEYFLKALDVMCMENYWALDISATSINLTKKYIEFAKGNIPINCAFLCEDFLGLETKQRFDVIVMGEVLEHVEEPLKFLCKIKEIFSGKGMIFITVPINAPAKDHIYLFRDIETVLEMVKLSGLNIVEYKCFTGNNREVNKAIKNKEAILMALIMN